MGRKRIKWLVCLVALLYAIPVWAGTGGGASPEAVGTEMTAGIVVDYVGRLRFQVLERHTESPIEGAYIEVYMPVANRYILVGKTDADGYLEMNLIMDPSGVMDDHQLENGKNGNLYIKSKEILYRVYKSHWLPYPRKGSVVIEEGELFKEVKVYLYYRGPGDPDSPPDPPPEPTPPGPGSQEDVYNSIKDALRTIRDTLPPLAGLNTDGIPKTGVAGAMPYWLAGLLLCLVSGGLIVSVIKNDDSEKRGGEIAE